MKAYVIGNYTIHNEEMYMRYCNEVMPTVAQFNWKTLVLEHDPGVLEGTPHSFTVAVEFPSRQQAYEWYHSDVYQNIVELRKKSVTGWVQVVRQFLPPKEVQS